MQKGILIDKATVRIRMIPVKPRPGLKELTCHVYPRFGHPKERIVQSICDAVGGETVYFKVTDPFNLDFSTIPVYDWKGRRMAASENGCSTGLLTYLYDILLRTSGPNVRTPITVFGEDRVEWKCEFESGDDENQTTDREPDASTAGEPGQALDGQPVADF